VDSEERFVARKGREGAGAAVHLSGKRVNQELEPL